MSSSRNLLLAVVGFLALASAAFATTSISRTGSCSASGATSCTFSATKTGDLKIVFAYRSASTTAPSLPTGWTSIANGATASSGTTAAYRIGCNVSSSTSDTATGAWTNASDVVGISYSGTLAGATTTCNTTGIGGKAANNAKTSATLNYAALTMTNSDGSSWVAGFAGDSAGGLCTPSGMGSVSTAGSGPAIIGNDTNGAATSWSSTNCTVTSGTWMSYVVEILGTPGNFVHIGPGASVGPTSGTSLTLTLGNNPLTGHLVIVGFVTDAVVTSVSIHDSNSNVYTISPNSPSTNSPAQAYLAYLLNAPANATSSISLSWTGTANGTAWGDEYALTQSGTTAFDIDGAGTGASGTSINTPSITPNGSNELVYVVAISGGVISAPVAGATLGIWIGTTKGIVNGNDSEYALNRSAASATQFTQSTGLWASMGGAFEFVPPSGTTPRMTLLGVGP